MKEVKIRFRDLTWPVKVGIIMGWVVLIFYLLAFVVGFIVGLVEVI